MANILICDDEKDIVSALEIYLKSEGYEIFKAYNGEEALDVMANEEIHLVLLDVKQFNPDRHLTLTERKNEQTLKTAEWLEKNGKALTPIQQRSKYIRWVKVPAAFQRSKPIVVPVRLAMQEAKQSLSLVAN